MLPCDTGNLSDFNRHIRYYEIEKDMSFIWSMYTEVSLKRFWHGPIANFDTMYDPLVKTLYTTGDSDIPGVNKGQIIFINLFLEDYIHIPVAFQIETLDTENKIIEFVYMEENTSHGKQIIYFHTHTVGGIPYTLIRHESWFRSNSSLRDALYYGYYHTQTVDEFHQSVAVEGTYSIKPVTERYIKRKGLSF